MEYQRNLVQRIIYKNIRFTPKNVCEITFHNLGKTTVYINNLPLRPFNEERGSFDTFKVGHANIPLSNTTEFDIQFTGTDNSKNNLYVGYTVLDKLKC